MIIALGQNFGRILHVLVLLQRKTAECGYDDEEHDLQAENSFTKTNVFLLCSCKTESQGTCFGTLDDIEFYMKHTLSPESNRVKL